MLSKVVLRGQPGVYRLARRHDKSKMSLTTKYTKIDLDHTKGFGSSININHTICESLLVDLTQVQKQRRIQHEHVL